MILPTMYRIRQKVDPPVVKDVASAVRTEIRKLNLEAPRQAGRSRGRHRRKPRRGEHRHDPADDVRLP